VAQILIFSTNSTTAPAPPAPSITGKPAASTTQPNATLTFTDTQAGVTFKCALDGATATACTSGVSYSNLDVTGHCFTVVALDSLNQSSPATQYCWTITSVPFTMYGSFAQPFSPGAAQYDNLQITNPNNFAITVTGVTVTVTDGTTKNGQPNPACVGSQNLVVSHAFSGTVTVPASATITVPQAQQPQFTMPNLPTNQDACKGTTFNFSYSGTATL
jgi:hypothetical protein